MSEVRRPSIQRAAPPPSPVGKRSSLVTPRTSVTEQPAAIGIMFDIEDIPEAGPALVVKQLVKGGSAQMAGTIAAGDVVSRIDSTDFSSSVCANSDSALASVKEVTSGTCGSTLVLHIFRPSDGRKFEATLTRGNAHYFSLKAELNRLTDAAASEAAHLDELRPQMLQSEQEGAAAMSAHANAQAQLTELEDSLQAKASLRDQIHSELKRLIADLRPLENAIEMDARDEQKLVQLHEQSCHQLKAIDDSIARALERKEALAVQFNTDDLLRQQCEQRERLLLDQLGERIRTEKQQRETRDSDRRALDETRSSLEQRLRDISAARALALEEAERLEKKAASTVELTNTVLTQRTQLDAALNEAELARHEVDSSLASADTRKAAFEAQILELEQAIRSSTRSQEELRRRLDSAAAASAQLQQDLMLELHKISAESRKKEDELMQFNVEAASKLRACQSAAKSEQAVHSRELSEAENEINRMKAAIVHESAVIDTLLARVAASKLAHSEADDQYAQLMQALEAEDAAVLNVQGDLIAAQLQHQAIEKEIGNQSARLNAALAEIESLRVSSAEMKRQLENDVQVAEAALVDLRHRLSVSQNELTSAKLEVGETMEIARRKAERAAVFKKRHSELVGRVLGIVRMQEEIQESLARTQAPPDVAPGQAVARPYLLASYSEDDVLGVIDGDSFLA